MRQWTGKGFVKPVKDVRAFRWEGENGLEIFTWPQSGDAKTPRGSEIIDKDGNVYVVEKLWGAGTASYQGHIVKLKPKDK